MDRQQLQKRISRYGWFCSSSQLELTTDKIFLDTFVCQANQNGTGYFFFEVCSVYCSSLYSIDNAATVLRRNVEGCPVRWCRGEIQACVL